MSYRLLSYFALFLSLLFPSLVQADSSDFKKGYFELKGAVGYTRLFAEDADMQITSVETDEITFDDQNAVSASLGVAYAIPFNTKKAFTWWPFIKGSVDVTHQFKETFSGDVSVPDSDAVWHNRTEINNTTLMFNLNLGVLRYKEFSTFILGGIGPAWTEVTYKDSPKTGSPPGMSLDSHSNTTFAAQGGAGVGYLITPQLNLTLTWLYTHLGDVETAEDGDIPNISGLDLEPAKFGLSEQSVFLGLEWRFI
jgi:opacity protein-like surface antigen